MSVSKSEKLDILNRLRREQGLGDIVAEEKDKFDKISVKPGSVVKIPKFDATDSREWTVNVQDTILHPEMDDVGYLTHNECKQVKEWVRFKEERDDITKRYANKPVELVIAELIDRILVLEKEMTRLRGYGAVSRAKTTAKKLFDDITLKNP